MPSVLSALILGFVVFMVGGAALTAVSLGLNQALLKFAIIEKGTSFPFICVCISWVLAFIAGAIAFGETYDESELEDD